jgi:L-lactate dehydrogenase complex protein LldG
MTVTSANGDPDALSARFRAELTALHGSCEIVESPAEARMALIARLQEWWTGDEASVKGARLITGQERQVLSWSPAALPVVGVAEALADMGFQTVTPLSISGDADRAAVRHIRYGLTGVEAAFASTGSMLVASGSQTNRIASLLPLRHVALIPFSRLYPTIESWLAAQRQDDLTGFMRQRANLTLISGPSKSGDIEMNLTLGVHGPRHVHAILFDDRE